MFVKIHRKKLLFFSSKFSNAFFPFFVPSFLLSKIIEKILSSCVLWGTLKNICFSRPRNFRFSILKNTKKNHGFYQLKFLFIFSNFKNFENFLSIFIQLSRKRLIFLSNLIFWGRNVSGFNFLKAKFFRKFDFFIIRWMWFIKFFHFFNLKIFQKFLRWIYFKFNFLKICFFENKINFKINEFYLMTGFLNDVFMKFNFLTIKFFSCLIFSEQKFFKFNFRKKYCYI